MTGKMAPPEMLAVRYTEPDLVWLPSPRREIAKMSGKTPDYCGALVRGKKKRDLTKMAIRTLTSKNMNRTIIATPADPTKFIAQTAVTIMPM